MDKKGKKKKTPDKEIGKRQKLLPLSTSRVRSAGKKQKVHSWGEEEADREKLDDGLKKCHGEEKRNHTTGTRTVVSLCVPVFSPGKASEGQGVATAQIKK